MNDYQVSAGRPGLMTRVIFVSLLALCAATLCSAQGLETGLLQDQIDELYREAGYAIPTVSLPVSRGELRACLERLIDFGPAGGPLD